MNTVMSPSLGSPEHPYLVQKTAETLHRPPGAFLCLEAMCTNRLSNQSSLNVCRQMALFEMVHTLILRFANMKKLINSLNLSTPIFRTLQYMRVPTKTKITSSFPNNKRTCVPPDSLALTKTSGFYLGIIPKKRLLYHKSSIENLIIFTFFAIATRTVIDIHFFFRFDH